MAYELPEFSEDLAYCDPCGWTDADTEYVPAIAGLVVIERRVNPFGGGWPVFAFLKRTCLRCGFQWAEAPLPPRQEDQLCDVSAISGDRCKMPAGHFDTHTSPHLFGPSKRG